MYLKETIKEIKLMQDHAITLIFPYHHLHKDWKNEYLITKKAFTLCNNLIEIYEYQNTMILRTKNTCGKLFFMENIFLRICFNIK